MMAISKQHLKQLFLVFFSFSIILSIMLFIFDHYISKNHTINLAMFNAPSKIEEKQHIVNDYLEESEQTLQAIYNLKIFQEYLNNKNSNLEDSLQNVFYSFALAKIDFMQLRYIDKNGFEKLRIDRNDRNSSPFIVSNNKLQNKADRYYFSDSINKELNKVWFSALDLNIEHGKVEIPYKPTLRAIMPVSHNNQFEGILIINYFMEDIIRELTSTTAYNTILCNDKGFAIYHYDNEKSWSFYKLGQWNLKEEFPNDYKNILSQKKFHSEKFSSLILTQKIADGLIIILQPNEKNIDDGRNSFLYETAKNLSITLILSILMTLIVVKFFSRTLLNLEELQKLNKKLKDVSIKNKIALRSSSLGIWEWDFDTNKLVWDDQMYTIYGIERVQNKIPFDVWSHAVDKVEAKAVEAHLKHAVATNSEYDISFWITRGDGERRYIKALGINQYDENGKAIKMVGSNQDITKTKNLTDELYNLNMELEEKVQKAVQNNRDSELILFEQSKLSSLGEMIGNIAHQWRQPLTVISMSAGGLTLMNEFKKWDYEKAKSFLDGVDTNIQYLSETIDIFKNFIREKKDFAKVDLEQRIKIVKNIIGSTLKQKDITLIEDIPKEKIEFETITGELDQVIINIIHNAQDVIEEREIKEAKIYLKAYEKEDTLYITIEDNAGGIDPKVLPKIFEPYFTTKHKSRGTGLGLHMSYKIITESLKGKIYATNGANGAIFHIELPKHILTMREKENIS